MSIERLNFDKKNNVINIDEVKEILFQMVGIETTPNLLYVIKQIKENVILATDSEDKEEIKKYLENIKRNDNYLSEKYRDTNEKRNYVDAVEKIISFLEEKIKLIKKTY
jgi:hypothetical protein